MKILIIGCGVIGSIFGDILSKSRNNVCHYIRSSEKAEKLKNGIELQLFDGREKIETDSYRSVYIPQITSELKNDDYELVIVSVNSHQLEGLLQEIKGRFNGATFLLFNNYWDEAEMVEKYLPGEKYIFGIPASGGGFAETNGLPVIRGAVGSSVTIGSINTNGQGAEKTVSDLFAKAGIKANVEKNMLHWLWTHYAVICGLNVASVCSGGGEFLLGSIKNIKNAVCMIKEALKTCEARGVNIREFSDPASFMLPAPVISMGFWLKMKTDKCSSIITLEYHGGEEMKAMYSNILKATEKYGINAVRLRECKTQMRNA